MTVRTICSALSFAIALCLFPLVAAAQKGTVSCPAGQAVQSVDFDKRTLSCVPLPSGSQWSAVRVVDNSGQLVGMLMDHGVLVRQFGNEWHSIHANSAGFSGDVVLFWYQSSDCTGTAYIAFDQAQVPHSVAQLGTGASATFYVPTPNTETNITVASFQPLSMPGTCEDEFAPFPLPTAIPTLVNVTTTLPWRLSD